MVADSPLPRLRSMHTQQQQQRGVRGSAWHVIGALVLAAACAGDDGSVELGATDASTGPSSTEGSTGGAADDASTTDATADDTGGEPVVHGALVLGTLAESDLEAAKAMHDQIAMAGEDPAAALGDFGHDVLLGTSLLGTTQDQFLALDQWNGLDGALTLYGDPEFQAGFGMLFARPPSLQLFERREQWYGWGDLSAGDDAVEHWFVVVRGTLAGDLDEARDAHDMLAMAGESDAKALGDVAHVVWLGSDAAGTAGASEFFAVDVWVDDASIEAFYGNPDFQAAFGALFSTPPTVGVYRSTDWYQW